MPGEVQGLLVVPPGTVAVHTSKAKAEPWRDARAGRSTAGTPAKAATAGKVPEMMVGADVVAAEGEGNQGLVREAEERAADEQHEAQQGLERGRVRLRARLLVLVGSRHASSLAGLRPRRRKKARGSSLGTSTGVPVGAGQTHDPYLRPTPRTRRKHHHTHRAAAGAQCNAPRYLRHATSPCRDRPVPVCQRVTGMEWRASSGRHSKCPQTHA